MGEDLHAGRTRNAGDWDVGGGMAGASSPSPPPSCAHMGRGGSPSGPQFLPQGERDKVTLAPVESVRIARETTGLSIL